MVTNLVRPQLPSTLTTGRHQLKVQTQLLSILKHPPLIWIELISTNFHACHYLQDILREKHYEMKMVLSRLHEKK